MNREEAEEYAKEMTYRDAVCNALQGRCIPYRKATLIKLYELLDMVEQEPCEDAISRQAVLDAITANCIWENEYNLTSSRIKKAVENLPPVNAQTKTGHWIFDEILDKHYYCSECKSMGVDYWDFCPYCGAKMIEPQESEDKTE